MITNLSKVWKQGVKQLWQCDWMGSMDARWSVPTSACRTHEPWMCCLHTLWFTLESLFGLMYSPMVNGILHYRRHPKIFLHTFIFLLNWRWFYVPKDSTNTGNDGARIKIGQNAPHENNLEHNLTTDRLTLGDYFGIGIDSPDLWSAAYREAVENFGGEIDLAILEERNVVQLFRELEDIKKEVTHESAFLRGVQYLHSIWVPLERFKLALDLASPLTNLEPTATTVCGVIRSVTAVSFKNFRCKCQQEIITSKVLTCFYADYYQFWNCWFRLRKANCENVRADKKDIHQVSTTWIFFSSSNL